MLSPLSRLSLTFLAAWLWVASGSVAQDTDGDGKLDIVDVAGFDPLATPQLSLVARGIEDLDGASELSQVRILGLGINDITQLDTSDFAGLSELRYLYLFNNQIETIEPYAFAGLNLRDLNLNGNRFAHLSLEGIAFEELFHLGIDRADVTSLSLEQARVSQSSFQEILDETTAIHWVSLVGLQFTDGAPADLGDLLDNTELREVRVDANLYDTYRSELDAFGNQAGNSLLILSLGDCDGDGQLTAEDLSCVTDLPARDEVLEALGALPGDFNGDAQVAFDDFLVFAANFGREGADSYAEGNVDLQDGVNFADFLVFAGNFGRQSAPAGAEPIPEPSCTTLLAGSLLAVGFLRRRRANSAKNPQPTASGSGQA